MFNKREYNRKWAENNPEKIKGYNKKYYQKNKEKIKELAKEQIKGWRKENPKKAKEYKKEWERENKDKRNRYRKEWRDRMKNSPEYPKFRLDLNMANAIWYALKRNKNHQKWQELVGYTIKELIKHLEGQFDEKMDWQNYGSYWWVDHIKPKSLFKYDKPEDEEFKKCWALTNLQPLEKIANLKKFNHYEKQTKNN